MILVSLHGLVKEYYTFYISKSTNVAHLIFNPNAQVLGSLPSDDCENNSSWPPLLHIIDFLNG